MNSYSKPRIHVLGLTSVLLQGSSGSLYDFGCTFKYSSC
jgi:hypothetical protein